METKQCTDCKQTLPVKLFTSDKARKGGLSCYCRDCFSVRKKRYREGETPEKRKVRLALAKVKRQEYSEKTREYMKTYYENNAERLREYRSNRYPEIKGYCKNYNTVRARTMKQRTFPEQKKAIVAFYQNCPKGYHVDHIVPVKHPLVSGLHVLANLQYLPASENQSKRNRFTIE